MQAPIRGVKQREIAVESDDHTKEVQESSALLIYGVMQLINSFGRGIGDIVQISNMSSSLVIAGEGIWPREDELLDVVVNTGLFL